MPQALIIVGVLLALAGIGSIAAGAPSWVLGLNLGTALIQSGAIGLVGGFLLVGIGFVLRALRDLSKKIDVIALGSETVAPNVPVQSAPPMRAPAPPTPRVPGKRDREAVPPPSGRREPPPFSAREEIREPALPETEEEFAELEERAPRPARSRFPESEPRIASPRGGGIPERERPRERSRPQPERTPIYEEYEEAVASSPPPRNSGGNAQPTIVRSGIIGGMAYTLYTDGSIEAELPIGTVRFASIEELQEHVSQTGEDADIDFGAPRPPR